MLFGRLTVRAPPRFGTQLRHRHAAVFSMPVYCYGEL
jgi:hypothetical protein